MLRFLIIPLAAGVLGGVIAHQKGRNPAGWFLLCAIFPILLALLLLLPGQSRKGATVKKCPYCAEAIKEEAVVCKHCGRELPIDMVQCPSCKKFVPKRPYCSECHRTLRH